MANSLIPYSFVPGTKAMASEVNANFIALAQAVEDGKTFTTESIEDFRSEMEESLDESLGGKLETDLSNCKNITNCVLEIPQRFKLELNASAGTITLKEDSVIIVPNGFEDDGVTPKFDYITLENDVTSIVPSYTRSNGILFVQPDTNFLADYPPGQGFSGTTAPDTYQYMMWYDTANNLMKRSNDNGKTWLSGLSFPLGLVSSTSTGGYTSINQTFHGFGYIGSSLWIDKGVRMLIPNYRNEDGTLKNQDFTTEKIYLTHFASNYSRVNGNLVFLPSNISNNIHIWNGPEYDSAKNIMVSSAEEYSMIILSVGGNTVENGVIKSINMPLTADLTTPLNVITSQSWSNSRAGAKSSASALNPAVVVTNYVNGTNWYRVWSDGWIEQGGRGGGTYSKTFLKAFRDTNYTLIVTPLSTDGSNDNCMVKAISTTGFTAWVESNNSGFWYACGY